MARAHRANVVSRAPRYRFRVNERPVGTGHDFGRMRVRKISRLQFYDLIYLGSTQIDEIFYRGRLRDMGYRDPWMFRWTRGKTALPGCNSLPRE